MGEGRERTARSAKQHFRPSGTAAGQHCGWALHPRRPGHLQSRQRHTPCERHASFRPVVHCRAVASARLAVSDAHNLMAYPGVVNRPAPAGVYGRCRVHRRLAGGAVQVRRCLEGPAGQAGVGPGHHVPLDVQVGERPGERRCSPRIGMLRGSVPSPAGWTHVAAQTPPRDSSSAKWHALKRPVPTTVLVSGGFSCTHTSSR